MPVLDAQSLSKSIGPRVLLDDVSFTIGRRERVGLVGANGCGKTTLARILAGLEPPDSGNIALRRGARVALLSQLPTFDPDSTVRGVVAAGLVGWQAAKDAYDEANRALEATDASDQQAIAQLVEHQAQAAARLEQAGGWDVDHQIDTVLTHLGIEDKSGSVANLSGGEARRVALAQILVSAPDLAILDEPTNHLDVETIEWLERYLAQDYPGAVLLITHDRYVLDNVVERTFEIEAAKVFQYDGGYEAYITAKAERQAQQARADANRANYLRRELTWLRRQPKARTGKQKARQQRIQEVFDAQPATVERVVKLRADTVRTGKSILEADGLRVAIDDRVLVEELTLIMTPGQRIGILGPSGCGKTTLIRTLLGERPADGGAVKLGKNTVVNYLSQLRDALDPALSVRQNVTGDRGYLIIGDTSVDIFGYLARFLFSGAQLDQPVSTLSGGERMRVALAILLARPSNLLVLDEPTNDLDVQTISALEAMIESFDGAAIVVTHDRWFLDRVATDIIAFQKDGVVEHVVGNYQLYRRLKATRDAKPAAAPSTPPKKAKPKPKAKGLTYAERLELEAIEERIEAADAEVARLEAELSDPELYRDDQGHQRAAELTSALAVARETADTLVARWEELELKKEAGG